MTTQPQRETIRSSWLQRHMQYARPSFLGSVGVIPSRWDSNDGYTWPWEGTSIVPAVSDRAYPHAGPSPRVTVPQTAEYKLVLVRQPAVVVNPAS
ncbi:hypothetical protein PISMIDRAFT_673295 [Pisolithus microcarpus 441]|uniref:Uncharacterized protein n=1 Tax=Pisolithus microcarpus 441 TaxID=765257 RepID=A0A0C9ZSK2_9AGAM|nr:hypothetical protein PISMIDRAFT_673295 [Pisolithus microcarpus 441]